MRDRRLEKLEAVLAPVIETLGCELWGVEYSGPTHKPTLRIFIDSENGITLEDCERVSRQVGVVLDVEDPVPGEYTLEVSSPGMDRPLFKIEQCEEFIGGDVRVRSQELVSGRKNFKGQLVAVKGNELVIRIGEDEYAVPFDSIDKARVVPEK